jgi:TAG lipase/steryl ester hydrolase/phospholipase A2/LPA acyltransferase
MSYDIIILAQCNSNVLFYSDGLFSIVRRRLIDGSVENDLPMTRLAEMFNVNHFIVWQVNPYVVPFLAKDDLTCVTNAQNEGFSVPGWVYTITDLARHETLHRMHMLAELGIFPNLLTKARSVLSQKYTGDITIQPEIPCKDVSRMLQNPTAEFMIQTCLRGERATWPELSRIRSCCAVELELDAAVQAIRKRVVAQPIQAVKVRDDGEVLLSYHRKKTTSSRSSSTPPPPQSIANST